MNKPIFEWDEELGYASCILTDGDNCFYGSAQCHDEDKDMKSEKTGCEIAYMRAKIHALCHMRDFKIKPMLAAYKQLFYSMNKSKHFNPKSYENKMLQRKIHEKELDLTTTNEMIATERRNLRMYIDCKEKLYAKVRGHRNKGQD